AQLKINFVRRASRSVVGIAADTFGRAIFGLQCATTAPAARKFGKGAEAGRGGMAIAATRAQAGMAVRASTRKIRVRKGRFPFKVGVELPKWGPPALRQMGFFRFQSRMPVCRLQSLAAFCG